MKKISAFLILIVLVVSCKEIVKGVEQSASENLSDSNFKKIEVDSLYALSVPKYMESIPNLNTDTSLNYGNNYKSAFTVVINEDKQDFIEYSNEIGAYSDSLSVIENFALDHTNNLKYAFSNVKDEIYGLVKIHQYNARQHKLTGTIDGLQVAYIIAYLETDGDLFMIANWTPTDSLPRFESTFKMIIDSFEYTLKSNQANEI